MTARALALTPAQEAQAGLTGRVVTNTLAQFVQPGARMTLGIVLVSALSRYLGPVGFGEYALVFAHVAIFNGIFNEWGLGTILLREISRYPEERANLLLSGAALQALIAVASYGLMVGSLFFLGYPAAVSQAIALYGLMLLLTPLDILALPFHADLRLVRLVPPTLLGVVLNFGFLMLVILMKGSLVALAAAALVALVVQYAWVTRLSLGRLRFTAWPSVARWKSFAVEAWPLGVVSVLASGMQQLPILVLTHVSLGATGLFSAANRIPQQLALIPITVRNSTFPLLSQSWVRDREQFARRLDRMVRASLFLAVPAMMLGVGLADPLMRLLFGPDFADGAVPFALLVVVFALLFPGVLVSEALVAAGFQRINLAILAVGLPLLVALLFVLVPAHGAAGAAWALVVSYGAIVALTFGAARWRMGDAVPLRTVTLVGGASALGGVAVFFASSSPVGPVVAGTAGAALALAALTPLQPFGSLGIPYGRRG